MDTRSGEIHAMDLVEAMEKSEREHMKEMKIKPTRLQKKRGKVGRNEPCPCSSGLKFKKCCLISEKDKQ